MEYPLIGYDVCCGPGSRGCYPFCQCVKLCWPLVAPSLTGKCFLYCNGLMDHIYVCQNGTSCTSWYKTPTHFSGTLVSTSVAVGNTGSHTCHSFCPSLIGIGNISCLFACLSVPQDAFVKISRHEGLRSLWSGLPPTLWASKVRPRIWFKYLLNKHVRV